MGLKKNHTLFPVSYTHLDVYKRQVVGLPTCLCIFLCRCSTIKGETAVTILKVKHVLRLTLNVLLESHFVSDTE